MWARTAISITAMSVAAAIMAAGLVLLAGIALMGLLLASRIGGFLFYNPHPWEFTRHTISDSELVGEYRVDLSRLHLTEDQLPWFTGQERIILRADHSAAVEHMPEFGVWGDEFTCEVNGSGSWHVWARDTFSAPVEVRIDAPAPSAGSCPETSFITGSPLRQEPPYELFVTIGDPDNDEGYRLVRR